MVLLRGILSLMVTLIFQETWGSTPGKGLEDLSGTPIYDIPLKDIELSDTSLVPYRGKVLLIVNTASKCGYTSQLSGLQKLHEKYGPRGFAVLGFPSNDFGNQEPGTEDEIKAFCGSQYGVTFPLFAKVHVKGESRHPLYDYLIKNAPGSTSEVRWNFEKFLVDVSGNVVARFRSADEPLSPALIAAIEKSLRTKK